MTVHTQKLYHLGSEGVRQTESNKYAFFHSFYYEQAHIARKVAGIARDVLNNDFYLASSVRPLKSKRYQARSWAGHDENRIPCIYVAVCDDRHSKIAQRAIMLSSVIYDTSEASLRQFDDAEKIADAMNAMRFSWRPRTFRHH